ncbi:hypothetical protein [Ruminiclostridium cellulolyticum]|uniref:Lipoprotein n=1 Tax=Ruminiclostridium cellulolyticum (strain ATCC 35319 / DSM 5812 / JCM 6584 / H10) TaxID=394503 RepID=B8HZX4_RUMCH|nr:hypothetical protein [Ruminiclostridium cellulolyticum]ACL75474.1 conserved hypothetical protein [Ruminiclostridium cellulolyticum H10]
MKKIISLVMSSVLAVSLLAGCGSSSETSNSTNSAAPSSAAASSEANGDAVKTGLAVMSSIAKSKDAENEDGLAQVDSTIVAVTVDKDGKIVKCAIDAAQTKINFSAAGKIITDLNTEFKSKQQLKIEYGMNKASKIGKEWNEQADAFANYVVGKTVDEVKGIAVNAEGVPSDKELSATVSIHIADFTAAIEKAVNNAKDLGAKAGDKLGLGVTTNISKSADAGEKDGVAQAYSNYSATTFDADGKVTSCIIDASQSDVNFSKTGKITSDLKAPLRTKIELGADYGLVKASKIKKEWFEQTEALAKYAVGKTIDEIKGIAVNEEGVPSQAELTSSVTIHIGDYQTVIEKAVATAK